MTYWRTPLPPSAPIDAESDRFIEWLKTNNPLPYLSLAVGDWAMPVYRSVATDPLVSIMPRRFGPPVTFRLPANAEPMKGDDRAMVVLDRNTNQDISLFEFDRARDDRGA